MEKDVVISRPAAFTSLNRSACHWRTGKLMGLAAEGSTCQVPGGSVLLSTFPETVIVPSRIVRSACCACTESVSPQFGVRVWIVISPLPVFSAHMETLAELI